MVKGRLPRESNPLQNQPRGYAPSFDTTGEEDYERVSPKDPWPSANYALHGNIWLPVSENNPMPTQLYGSIVEEVIIGDDEIISAGSSVSFWLNAVYNSFSLHVRVHEKPNEPWSVAYSPSTTATTAATGGRIDLFSSDGFSVTGGVGIYSSAFSDIKYNMGEMIFIRFYNDSEVDNRFTVVLTNINK